MQLLLKAVIQLKEKYLAFKTGVERKLYISTYLEYFQCDAILSLVGSKQVNCAK